MNSLASSTFAGFLLADVRRLCQTLQRTYVNSGSSTIVIVWKWTFKIRIQFWLLAPRFTTPVTTSTPCPYERSPIFMASFSLPHSSCSTFIQSLYYSVVLSFFSTSRYALSPALNFQSDASSLLYVISPNPDLSLTPPISCSESDKQLPKSEIKIQ